MSSGAVSCEQWSCELRGRGKAEQAMLTRDKTADNVPIFTCSTTGTFLSVSFTRPSGGMSTSPAIELRALDTIDAIAV